MSEGASRSAEPAVPLWQALSFALLALCLLLHFLGLAGLHPYDFVWDMDASATQDVLLLNSGHPPAHLDHPKYVMAVAQAFEARLLRLGGLVSVANLQDLARAPQPLLAVAELNDRLRQVHALLSWLLVLLLSGLLWRLYPRVRWLPLLALPLLGLQAGPLYNALTMRTELYSLLLLACGLWIPVLTQAASPRRRLAAALLMGLLWGLALLNKVQSLSLLLLLPAFAAYVGYAFRRSEPEAQPAAELAADLATDPAAEALPESRSETAGWPSDRLTLALTGLSLAAFALIAGLALGTVPAAGRVAPVVDLQALASLPGSLGRFKLQLCWLLFAASGLLALPLAARIGRRSARAAELLRQWPWYLIGTLLAFALPLLALPGQGPMAGLALGWQYLATLMRTSVWLDASLLASGNNASGGTLTYVWLHRGDLLLLAGAAVALLALRLGQVLQRKSEAPRAELSSGLALAAVLLASLLALVLGNRPLLRDTLWFELMLGWGALLVLGHLAAGAASQSRLLRALPPLLVAAAALTSLQQAGRERESFYVFHAPYGGDEVPYDYFLNKSLYLRGANPYAEILDRAFQEDIPRIRRAIAQARDWRSVAAMAAAPLPNTRVPLRALALLEPGFPVLDLGQGWARCDSLLPGLQGAMAVALSDLEPRARARRYLNDLALDTPQGQLLAPGAPSLTLVPPFHYQLLLAIPEAEVAARDLPVERPAPLSLRLGEQRIAYQVYRLEDPQLLSQTLRNPKSAPPLLIFQARSVQPTEVPIWDPSLNELFKLPQD